MVESSLSARHFVLCHRADSFHQPEPFSGSHTYLFQRRSVCFQFAGRYYSLTERCAPRLLWVLGLSATFLFMRDRPSNKSPEPTAVGAVSSAVAVHVASRRWLSFFR